ncbi:MAG: GNAT family N-acetyltransferase, partial [Rhodoglobus sp.]|nr:GNAT family N-acetyltransferase [Rhodoglobus sp.]
MAGETDLATLLASMKPRLLDGDYVFCTIAGASYGDYSELDPLASYREAEGLTLVLARDAADRGGLPYDGVFRGITL